MGTDDTRTRSGLLAGEEASANGPAPFEQVANKVEKPSTWHLNKNTRESSGQCSSPSTRFARVLCFSTFVLSGTTKPCVFPVSAQGAAISPRSLGPFTGEQYL